MKQYEVTFIVDPVLSDTEIKQTSENYVDLLKTEDCQIVHVDEMGLRQLAYPIKNRNSGFYYCIEYQSDNGELIGKLELALRRDERIMRFLTIYLDKYGIKYNEDKRNGLIKKRKKPDKTKKKGASEGASKAAPAAKVAVKAEPKVEPVAEPKAEVKSVSTEEE